MFHRRCFYGFFHWVTCFSHWSLNRWYYRRNFYQAFSWWTLFQSWTKILASHMSSTCTLSWWVLPSASQWISKYDHVFTILLFNLTSPSRNHMTSTSCRLLNIFGTFVDGKSSKLHSSIFFNLLLLNNIKLTHQIHIDDRNQLSLISWASLRVQLVSPFRYRSFLLRNQIPINGLI